VSYERLRQHLPITPEEQRALAARLPLPLVDDLIEAGRLDAEAVPASGQRRLYLLARLAPAEVSDDDLITVGWSDERARRAFWRRLADGDISVLDDRRGLDPDQLDVLAELDRARATGRFPPALTGQRWLWPALEGLAARTAHGRAGRDDPFGSWTAVRRLLRVLQRAHRLELRGNTPDATRHFQRVRAEAGQLSTTPSAAGWEARNIAAYLIMRQDRSGRHGKEALAEISPGPRSRRLPEDKLPPTARQNLANNRSVLSTPGSGQEPGQVLNPYLVLGVADRASTAFWKGAWRALRQDLDEDGEALVNEARDAIQAIERRHDTAPLFLLPLDPQRWANPSTGHLATTHGAQRMPRRTLPATAEDQDLPAVQAAQGIIARLCLRVGLPVRQQADPTDTAATQEGNR
jgi:hypothetical protein